ncbi:MAG: rod shape-determining protein RodA [Alphaproteobacteria bacterium]|nr:rod shape-determining protein RodA [Alphaproteobacteria bacterium]
MDVSVQVGTGSAGGLSFARSGLVRRLAQLPWGLVLFIVAIALIGTGMLHSVTHDNAAEADLPLKHLARFAVAFAVMIVLALVPLRYWMRLALPVYVMTVLLLVAVEFFGEMRGGAQRWLAIGPVNVQPSEFMKLALVLVLARYYHTALPKAGGRYLLHVPALALMLLPAALIFKQPDFGTTLALLASGGAIIFVAGLPWRVIALTGLIGATSVPVVYNYVLAEYQRERVDTFVEQIAGQSTDALGDGYQIEQAKIAVGSGGLRGKGYLKGTQSQLDYIPEQHTDFILTVVAEELGFFGASGLLLLWATIIGWGLYIAWRCQQLFGRLAAAGAVAMLGFYVVFNVGMVLGLLPVVGVPMPLVSYGGTAMLTVMAGFGVVLAADIHRKAPSSAHGWF